MSATDSAFAAAPAGRSALLFLSFGGPEKSEDVIPFLENVTRGRGIPRERLEKVGEHYYALGGRSPINDQNKQIIANIEAELATRGVDLPVYFGNRNWEPYVEDTMVQLAREGFDTVYVFVTSAWGGYSGCGQYNEDIRRALEAVREAGLEAPRVQRLPHFHDHPAFVSAFAAAVDAARAELPASVQDDADLVFTAHSVPNKADDTGGPRSFGGNLYSEQVLNASRLIQEASSFAGQPGSGASLGWTGQLAAGKPVGGRGDGPAHTGETAGVDLGVGTPHDVELVWQSRSGSPHVPWLEPDVCDHLEARVAAGNKRPIVLCPVGFITDHVEVLWDLDTEVREVAEEHGVPFVRAATPGLDSSFASMIVDLVAEVADGELPVAEFTEAQRAAAELVKKLGTVPNFGGTCDGAPCAPGCCGAQR